MMNMQDQTLQEFILLKQVLPKEHVPKQILPQARPWLLNLSVLFLKANATRNKRCIAILTDTPVKLPSEIRRNWDKWQKEKEHQKRSKRRLLITLKEILRRRGK
jgi:hypothetical protein